MTLTRLPTKNRLLNWRFQTPTNYLLCNSALESRNHLFFYYSFSWNLRQHISSRCSFQSQRNWKQALSSMILGLPLTLDLPVFLGKLRCTLSGRSETIDYTATISDRMNLWQPPSTLLSGTELRVFANKTPNWPLRCCSDGSQQQAPTNPH